MTQLDVLTAQSVSNEPERFQAEIIANRGHALLREPPPPCLLRALTGSGKTFMLADVSAERGGDPEGMAGEWRLYWLSGLLPCRTPFGAALGGGAVANVKTIAGKRLVVSQAEPNGCKVIPGRARNDGLWHRLVST